MNKVTISRIFVGSLFIISGIIKANDPLGFSYKLEEYFAVDVLNWAIFQGSEVFLAALISVGEIVLGVAILAGEKSKLTSWLLLIMMVFFTFLTGYTAIGNWFFENFDKEITHTFENIFGFAAREIHYFKDCGCFGDAIPFTPWDSFVKDLVLMVFTLILFKNKQRVVPNTASQDKWFYGISFVLISAFFIGVTHWYFPIFFVAILFGAMWAVKKIVHTHTGWAMGAKAFVLTSLLPIYVLMYLPVKDFRPFAIGENIPYNMSMPEDKEPPIYTVDYTMKSKTTGDEMVVSAIDYLEKEVWKNQDLEIVSTGDQYLVKEGYEPPIHDFILESVTTGEDKTMDILNEDLVFLWISYDLENGNEAAQKKVNEVSQAAKKAGISCYELTASTFEETENYKQKHGVEIEMFSCDATALKTVIRSNPGLIVIKKGTVVAKYAHRSVSTFAHIQQQLNL